MLLAAQVSVALDSLNISANDATDWLMKFGADISDDISPSETFDLLPPYWNDVNDLNDNFYNYNADFDALEVDPWNYMHRLSLYKYFIDNIKHCAWEEENNTHNKLNTGSYLWGLPLQHGWQFNSGRLSESNSTIIDPNFWWGDMNYYLSIIPYFGLIKSSINAPKIVLINSDIANKDLFCSSTDDISCGEVIGKWTEFFNYLDITKASCDVTAVATRNDLDFNLTDVQENVLHSLWSAHIASINYALPLFKDNSLLLLSEPEALFGNSWASLVDLIARTCFPTNMKITNILQNLLPPRLLVEGDQPPAITDFNRLENRAVALIDGLYLLDEKLGGLVSIVWSKMMCTETDRAQGREMIILGLYRLKILVEDTLLLLQSYKYEHENSIVCTFDELD